MMLKKVIITIILTLLILKTIELGADWAIKKYPESKTNYISQKQFNAQVIFHGSCEVEWVINPSFMDSALGLKSYNLATAKSNFADNYLDLLIFLKNQKKPQYLLLQTTPEAFASIGNTVKVFKFVNYFNDTAVINVLKELDKSYMSAAALPYLKFSYYNNHTLFSVFAGTVYGIANIKEPRFINGYKPPIGFISMKPDALEEKIENYKWSDEEEKYFRKIIKLCHSNNIKVVLFRAPSYFKYQRINPVLNEKNKLIKKMAAEYNVPYFSYESLEMNKDSSNFFSSSKMSIKGSKLFSEIFAKQLKDSIFN